MWLLATHLESWSGKLLSTHVARRSKFSCCPNQWDEQRQKQVASHLKAHYWWDAIHLCLQHSHKSWNRNLSEIKTCGSFSYVPSKQQENAFIFCKPTKSSASRASGRPSPRLAPDDWRSIVQALKIGKSIQIQRSLNVTECLEFFWSDSLYKILAFCSCYEWALGLLFLKLKNTKHFSVLKGTFLGIAIQLSNLNIRIHFSSKSPALPSVEWVVLVVPVQKSLTTWTNLRSIAVAEGQVGQNTI